MTAIDPAGLAERVRDQVRRRGIDPVRETHTVRQIAEQVAAEHERESLTGTVAPIDDLTSFVGDLVSRVSGFGVIQQYLDDPLVEEIWINEPS